jgi:hypothetical protein
MRNFLIYAAQEFNNYWKSEYHVLYVNVLVDCLFNYKYSG